MRVLLVSQMYPGPHDPDLGGFIAQIESELERRGHQLERAVIDHRRRLKTKYAVLGVEALRKARRFRPEVVYAHFLVPAGALAALASQAARAPLVLTAHGADVRNIGAIPGVRLATALAVKRASAVVAVSDFLRRELEGKLPELVGRVEVIDCGVDLERFRGSDQRQARRRLRWDGEGPFFLFVGALNDRKNVVRLVRAFERVGRGRLALVGDGPLRPHVEECAGFGESGSIKVIGAVPHERVADWIAACDVLCLPSLVEPFGQVLLEAMASERSVLATTIGGPPEFVTPRAGVLADPYSVEAIGAGMRQAARLPSPNREAREAVADHDVRRQGQRIAAVLAQAAGGRPP